MCNRTCFAFRMLLLVVVCSIMYPETVSAQWWRTPHRRGRLLNPQIGVVVDYLDPAADPRAEANHRGRGRGRNRGRDRNRGRGRGRGPGRGPGGRGGWNWTPPELETHQDGHFELIGGLWADATPGDGFVDPELVFSVDLYGFPDGAEDAILSGFAAWEEVTEGHLFADVQLSYLDPNAAVFGDGINTVSMWELDDNLLAATFIIWDDVDDDGQIDAGEEFLEMDMVHNANVPWATDVSSPGGQWWDLQAVTTHEVGHVIGLDHPGDDHQRDFYQTMYATADWGETMKRSLESDGDIPGAQSEFLGYGVP